ncbi:hypothetical protein SAMN04515674_10323 [Pseudarcicella hirudinis]|uniref:Uncharacterized protein n=2 Tax=Pseudarcicella hirudinis TaxID=1079859 RepID=A0A1I5Q5D8_9BACT|nr:hypothetical protein SAMN04515674_10323 [Pseudarcicella hirudinis]
MEIQIPAINYSFSKPHMSSPMRFFILLCLLILGSFIFFSFKKHAFHTSLTEMNYNAREKNIEISIRIFTDDLEKVLSLENGNQKFIIENNDKNDGFVEKYIRKHFNLINSKNQKKPYNYIGKEESKDATWIYLEMPVNESVSGSKIQNDVLMDIFEDQVNIINLSWQGDKKSFIFNQKKKIQDI